jgi:hypothetical protein
MPTPLFINANKEIIIKNRSGSTGINLTIAVFHKLPKKSVPDEHFDFGLASVDSRGLHRRIIQNPNPIPISQST